MRGVDNPMTKVDTRPLTREELKSMVDPLYFASMSEQRRVIEELAYCRIENALAEKDASK